MEKIVIIADDLTGACDSGVQFAQKGLKSVVSFDLEYSADVEADVTIFDTNSRAMPKEEAYMVLRELASDLGEVKIDLLYKKIDSTLRGNIGIEIDAVMDELHYDLAIVAPALPLLGRTTEKGIHLLNEQPIHLTEIANDPKTPVKESDIVQLLSGQSKREAVLFPVDIVKKGKEAVNEKVKELLEVNKTLLVFDAKSTKDLDLIVENLKESHYQILWVGSAGLAESLSLDKVKTDFLTKRLSVEGKESPVLIVSGSRSNLAKRQSETILEFSDTKSVSLLPENLIQEDSRKLEILRCISDVKNGINAGNDVLLNVGAGKDIPFHNARQIPYIIEESLGEIASVAINDCKLKGIIMTGGDTAKAISKSLGVKGIELLGETERGLPLSRLIGVSGLLAVTKAGAFGTDKSLYSALKSLKGEG